MAKDTNGLTEAQLYAPDLNEGKLDVETYQLPSEESVENPYLKRVWAQVRNLMESDEALESESESNGNGYQFNGVLPPRLAASAFGVKDAEGDSREDLIADILASLDEESLAESVGEKALNGYATKAIGSLRGKPCKQGQAASRTGCIPAKKPTGKKPAAKPVAKVTAKDVFKEINTLRRGKPSVKQVNDLAKKLGTLTVAELRRIKGELKVKASGKKAELAKKIAKGAVKGDGKKPVAQKLRDVGDFGMPEGYNPPYRGFIEDQKKWVESISKDEYEALRGYIGGTTDYESLNGKMRKKCPDGSCLNKKESRILEGVVKALGKSKLREPITIYRGISGDEAAKFVEVLKEAFGKGKKIEFKGIISASPAKEHALMYGKEALFKITAKTGGYVHAIEKFSKTHESGGATNFEFIQKPNTRYKIKSIQDVPIVDTDPNVRSFLDEVKDRLRNFRAGTGKEGGGFEKFATEYINEVENDKTSIIELEEV